MAAIHAGMKRTFHQIDGLHQPTSASFSASSSRNASPRPPPSHEHSAPPMLRTEFDSQSKPHKISKRKVAFAPDASIVLIGIRGVGKSSLGILAATSYDRRLIESERAFHEATGVNTQSYRKTHGNIEYYKRHAQILEQLLETYSKNCVIVCTFSDLENLGASLITAYSKTHPVIHITRDSKGIQSYLDLWSVKKVERLLHASEPLLKSACNFVFYNLSEEAQDDDDDGDDGDDDHDSHTGRPTNLFFTLKKSAKDFRRLLRNVVGPCGPSDDSRSPLAQIPVHKRTFTLCATVTVSDILRSRSDLVELQIGVDAVELIIDCEGLEQSRLCRCIAEAYSVLRRSSVLPIILTATAWRSDQLTLLPASQTELISYCLTLGPEYCTVDLSLEGSALSALVEGRGKTKMIGSRHFTETPHLGWEDPACGAFYDQAVQLGCEAVSITMPARSITDNYTIQAFRGKVLSMTPHIPLICYNTGALGRTSVCSNTILTPVSLPSVPNGVEGCEIQSPFVSAKQVIHALFTTFVYEPMKLFIYGQNVSWSLSPAMHNAAYTACGMSHVFETHSAPDLDDFKRISREVDCGGFAVVQPFKVGVIPLLDGLSSHAKVIGSVNTVIPIRELAADGSLPSDSDILAQANRRGPVKALYGHNTDWIGVLACLQQGLSPANTVRPQSTALVCGAGGQARSAVYSLLSLGVRNIFVCNRTLDNAQTLADHFNRLIANNSLSELNLDRTTHPRIHVLGSLDAPWPLEYRHPTMIVSTVPTQSPNGSLIDFSLNQEWLKSLTGGVVIEIAYKPSVTPIIRQMKAEAHRGWVFLNGLDMLPEQAFTQFELFTGRRAPRELMREQIVLRQREAGA